MEDSGNYEQYLINILKNGDHRTRSMAEDLNIKPVIVDFDFVDPSKLPDITTTLTHYGDVYYIPIYDENKIITNKTLVVNAFYYLISNKSTKNNRDYLNNFNNVYGAMASDKPNLYYLLDNNLNLINNVINDTPIKVRGVIYNNEDLDLPSSYVNGYYDPSLYNPNDPSTRPIIVDNDIPENVKVINDLKLIDFPSGSNTKNVTERLKTIKNKLDDIKFVNKDATYKYTYTGNDIVYPVINPITGNINSWIDIGDKIYLKLAARFRNAKSSLIDESLTAKQLKIYPDSFDVDNKTELECRESSYFQLYDSYDYCYFWIGNYESLDGTNYNDCSFCSYFEFEIYNGPILTFKGNDSYTTIRKTILDRVNDLGYDYKLRYGIQILAHLWAAYDLGYYFTNFDCSNLPSKSDKYLYPVLDFANEGSTEYKAGWAKFKDGKYYPFNYDHMRTVCILEDLDNIYSGKNKWSKYKVDGIKRKLRPTSDEVAKDPIKQKPDAQLFNVSSVSLDELKEQTKNKYTRSLVIGELLAVGGASIVVGGIVFYISRDLLISLSSAGVILIIGALGVLILNKDNIYNNYIVNKIPTSAKIAFSTL